MYSYNYVWWILFFDICFIVICIYLIKVVPAYLKTRKKEAANIQFSISNDEKIIHKQTLGVDYLGGHPPFGSHSKNGGMIITDKRIIFSNVFDNKRFFSIPYEDVVNISVVTEESLTATRVILTGLLAPLWKKKRPFILIGMKNDIEEISSVGFGFAEPGLGSSFWPTSHWVQVISEQRYGWLKNKKTSLRSCLRNIGSSFFTSVKNEDPSGFRNNWKGILFCWVLLCSNQPTNYLI